MHIRSIQIENIRSIRRLSWVLPKNAAAPGWHVILGENGAGKSSFLRSVALALIAPEESRTLRQSWNEWLRKGEDRGRVRLELEHEAGTDEFSGKGRTPDAAALSATITIERIEGDDVAVKGSGTPDPKRHVWSKKRGWFSASFGPFRRFTGGDTEYSSTFYRYPRLSRHLSVFNERVALTEAIDWLKELKYKQLEKDPVGAFLEPLQKFINQPGFLPFDAQLTRISSDRVEFRDGYGHLVRLEELSDGYRSILSLTFELIRQMATVFGVDGVFSRLDPGKVGCSGVVLIDEVDVHLHPTWQRRIGEWFVDHFPHIQFLVTTHSPLICHAARSGTVFSLARPGSRDTSRMVSGDQLNRLVYGNILDAHSTSYFGDGRTSSDESSKLRKELASLNLKERKSHLAPGDRTRQEELRRMFPTAAHTSGAAGK